MIRIITDSLCDLTMDYAKELNIDIMPLTVRFGEDDFKCGIDLTNEAFYDKLTNDSNNPVSYTHLDVYKRQCLDRSSFFYE